MTPSSDALNVGGGTHVASAASGMGAPEPEWPQNPPKGVSRPERVSSCSHPGTSATDQADARAAQGSRKAKPTGRPKQFSGSPLKVAMTDEQRELVDVLAVAGGCSAAEAIRRLVDGTPVPQMRSIEAGDVEQYRAALEVLGGIRTELHRGVGNLYRLVRDSYRGQVPDDSELARVREGIEGGLFDLATVAQSVSRWSPW